MSNKLRNEIDKIEIPKELRNRVRKGVYQAKAEQSAVYRIPRPIVQTGIVLLFVSLLFGLAFIFPQMSDVFAKVPYLKTFFESKPITQVIEEELSEEGYSIHGVDESPYPDKIMYVTIDGTEDYRKDVEAEIEDKTYEILGSHNHDAFSVKVTMPKKQQDFVISDESKQFMNETEKIMDTVKQVIDEYGYEPTSFGVMHNTYDHRITIGLPDTEQKVEQFQQQVEQSVRELGFGKFPVEINVIDMERKEIEHNVAGKIIPVLHEGLRARKEFHTKGMAYSFHPLPLQIIVKTTIASDDRDAEELAAKIETTVQEFLTSDEIKPLLKGEPYRIIVRSADQKQIND